MIPSRRRLHLPGAGLVLGILVVAAPAAIVGRLPSGSGASIDVARAADESSSLEDYLVRKRAALLLRQNRPADQVEPTTLRARVRAESRSGRQAAHDS